MKSKISLYLKKSPISVISHKTDLSENTQCNCFLKTAMIQRAMSHNLRDVLAINPLIQRLPRQLSYKGKNNNLYTGLSENHSLLSWTTSQEKQEIQTSTVHYDGNSCILKSINGKVVLITHSLRSLDFKNVYMFNINFRLCRTFRMLVDRMKPYILSAVFETLKPLLCKKLLCTTCEVNTYRVL